MKTISLALLYGLISTVLSQVVYQTEGYGQLVSALIQFPMVAGLIYLVLALEGKRLEHSKSREDSFITIVTLMLTLITQMAKQAGSQSVSLELIKSIEAYIKAEQALSGKDK